MIYLTERWHHQEGFWTEWQCPPPPEGTGFKVIHDEWREDQQLGTIRSIIEIEPTTVHLTGEPRRPELLATPADRMRWKSEQ